MQKSETIKDTGITLIALVITIIVILVLAGVTIASLTGENGLLARAAEARDRTEEAKENEINQLNRIENYIALQLDQNGCLVNSQTINGEKGTSLNPTIPGGFKPVNVGTANWGNGESAPTAEAVSAGLVIEDSQGNQFVWVPVDGTNVKYERHTYTNGNDAGTVLADDDGWKTYYYRNYIDENGETDWEDSGGNSTSVGKYGGFYIARYEAGIPEEASFYKNEDGAEYIKTTAINTGKDVTTYTPVSKANYPVWNFITQINAKTVAEKMYNTESVKSGLIDSYAWDTTTQWLKNSGYNINNSTSWGNYYDSAFDINGLYALHSYGGDPATWTHATEYNKGSHSIVIGDRTETATGITDRNKANNIYDFAGNVYEWTTETGHKNGTTTTTYAVLRGGSFFNGGSSNPASFRSGSYSSTHYDVVFGFRVVLYLE